jgi:hypothetical protein
METTRMAPSMSPPEPLTDLRSRSVALTLEWVAWLMDRAVRVPGTRMRVGLDALLGLLPVGGDVITGLVQTGLVLVALHHYRVPRAIAFRMMGNVLIDVAVGAIPLLGDLFDAAFKANTRNIALLEEYKASQRVAETPRRWSSVHTVTDAIPKGMPVAYLVAIGAVLFAALGLMLLGFITLVRWLFS